MRKFSSYGPVDKDMHFFVPREELVQKACTELIGENPEKGGHYITVWAPRQTGKTWIMRDVLWRLWDDERFHAVKLSMEYLKTVEDPDEIAQSIGKDIGEYLNIQQNVRNMKELHDIFRKGILDRPLILILDEFDALAEEAISGIAGVFRHIYNTRMESRAPSASKPYLLHGVALIGVRNVLGIENQRGSPFNVQRSMHIPNLTYEEVDSMFKWYEGESGQKIEQDVIDRLFYETRGQPGLVSWFGELLTEGYKYFQPDRTRPVTSKEFDRVYQAAVQVLPNNNILNIISKARQEQYKSLVIEFFRTREKIAFTFDDARYNFLYMNGVIDVERTDEGYFAKFPCPFVQKRLFNYFSHELFHYMGQIFEPFEDISDTITGQHLNIKNLIRRYEKHLKKNREWLLKDAPGRKDLRVFEAVFHFSLYEYLNKFLQNKDARVLPEFPTGNGKVDMIIRYAGEIYALELKSYTDESEFFKAQRQAAKYAEYLSLNTIHLILFVESVPDEYRLKYETDYTDPETGITVSPVFAETGA